MVVVVMSVMVLEKAHNSMMLSAAIRVNVLSNNAR
jgi:hypothetical protein